MVNQSLEKVTVEEMEVLKGWMVLDSFHQHLRALDYFQLLKCVVHP